METTRKDSLAESKATNNPTSSPSTAKDEVSFENFINNLKPGHTSFFIKMGEPYHGVHFTLDPEIVKFSESDCLNILVTESPENGLRKIDLGKLEEIFKKCQKIENLKFFGVKITDNLLKLISKRCPNLKNLELNPQELEGQDRGSLDFIVEIRRLYQKCKELRNFVIRRPSKRVESFFTHHVHQEFTYDNVYQNWLFTHKRSSYNPNSLRHHNVNFPGRENYVMYKMYI